MKRQFITLLCAVCVFAVEAIDSIDFYTKITTVPDTPIDTVNHTINGHKYVDLGLPSGLLWATCNLGAESITDYGDSYAWGETTPKTKYNLGTYKWYTSETIVEVDADGFEVTKTIETYTKYNTKSTYGSIDNLTTLEFVDDAAAVNWGGDWRMPTEAEQDELCNYCTWTWVTLNGVKGYKVSSKAEGNSNYIFLPAMDTKTGIGWGGYYWSSSLEERDPTEAYGLTFYSSYYEKVDIERYNGRCVRAVCSPK